MSEDIIITIEEDCISSDVCDETIECTSDETLEVSITEETIESVSDDETIESVIDETLEFTIQEVLVVTTEGSAPGDTVVEQITHGESSTAGVSEEFSRSDHAHGTPPAEGGGSETFAHPNFITTSARDIYYGLNPSLLLDELIVTIGTLNRSYWQYSVSSVAWFPGDGYVSDHESTYNHDDIALNSTHREETSGNPHQTKIVDQTDVNTDNKATNYILMVNSDGNYIHVDGSSIADLSFSIATFSDGISDTSQLIGSGTWQAIGAVSFTATYNNGPPTAGDVALSGSATPWAGDLDLGTPFSGPTTNTEAVDYPSSRTGSIVFTLTTTPADTDTETINFSNTMRYGNSANATVDDTIVEALDEASGPNESRSQTFLNMTAGDYAVFAHAESLSSIAQVRVNTDDGYVTASFNPTRTSVTPAHQTTGLTAIENSALFEEAFEAIVSTDTNLGDGSNDFQIMTNSTIQNYVYSGDSTTAGTADGANEMSADDAVDSVNYNNRQTWADGASADDYTVDIVTTSSTYAYIVLPHGFGEPTNIYIDGINTLSDWWIDANGANLLAVTNDVGFTDDAIVLIFKNPHLGLGSPKTATINRIL